MPTLIGEFISDNVYDGKLLSSHSEKRSSCLAFVDAGYSEEQSDGTSWKVCEITVSQRELLNILLERTKKKYTSSLILWRSTTAIRNSVSSLRTMVNEQPCKTTSRESGFRTGMFIM
jgi:hypothetical protein